MTPKEKALELKQKFFPYVDWMDVHTDETNREWAIRNAKKCALITVDETLMVLWHTHKNETEYRFWEEVKKEIELL